MKIFKSEGITSDTSVTMEKLLEINEKMKDIAIYGAGGFGREVACLLSAINSPKKQWNLIGFFDDGIPIGYQTEYGKVVGGMEELNKYKSPLAVVIAVGSPNIIEKIVSKISNPNIEYPNIIAPDVRIFDYDNLSIGKGNIIGFRCSISCNVSLGDFNCLNGDIVIGHDSTIGSYNVLNTSVRIAGSVVLNNNNLLGISSSVIQQKKIGSHTTIGPNSVVIRHTKDNSLYFGVPATRINI